MFTEIRRTLLAATTAMLLAIPMAQARTTLEFWHSFNGGEGRTLGQIIQSFATAHPDIQIDAEYIGNYESIVAKLQAAIPAHRAPDVVIMEVTRYGLFAARGVLADLTPSLAADPLKDQLFDYAREVGVFNGRNYIIPFNSSTPVLYVNKTLLKEAGYDSIPEMKTFAEVQAVAQKATDALGAKGITGIAAPGQFARWGLVEDNGSEMIDPQTNAVLLDSPETVEAYQWMADLVYKHHLAAPDGVTNEDNGLAAFAAGKVALDFGSSGDYGSISKGLGDALGVLPMPCNKVCKVPIGGAGIGVLSDADQAKKDAAWTFISYLASPQVNAVWFAATGYMPINKGTTAVPVAADALKTEPGIRVAIDQLPFAVGRPRPVFVAWMRAKENQMWQAMALGQGGVPKTMADFAAETRAQAARPN